MNSSDGNYVSKTNWERIDAMADEDIGVSDLPPLTDEFFAKAKWLMPDKEARDQARLATLQELAVQELGVGY